jgi:hypothetical protein
LMFLQGGEVKGPMKICSKMVNNWDIRIFSWDSNAVLMLF